MSNEKNGFVEHALESQELVLHLFSDQGVECGEGFVEEPNVRLDSQ